MKRTHTFPARGDGIDPDPTGATHRRPAGHRGRGRHVPAPRRHREAFPVREQHRHPQHARRRPRRLVRRLARGAVSVNGAAADDPNPKDRLRIADVGWQRWAPVDAVAIAAHLIGGTGLLRNNRRTPVLVRLADGSYLSTIGGVRVRVIDARITVTVAGGTTFTGTYRLVTTLIDARRHPAAALVALYHQRWGAT